MQHVKWLHLVLKFNELITRRKKRKTALGRLTGTPRILGGAQTEFLRLWRGVSIPPRTFLALKRVHEQFFFGAAEEI